MTDFALIEGFDYYKDSTTGAGGMRSVWTQAGTGDWEVATGRFGVGQRCRLGDGTGATASMSRALPGGSIGPNFSVGFAYSQAITGSTTALFSLLNGATLQLNLRFDDTTNPNELKLYMNNTLLGTTGVIFTGAGETDFVWIDMFGTLADSGGHVEVWINNVKKIDFTGDTTNGAATFNTVQLRCPDGGGSSNWANFDDLLILPTNTRIGDSRVDYEPVNGDTADKDFTPSTGTDNYACLDEVPVNNSDYVSAVALNDMDIYELTNLAADTSTITGVQPIVLIDKTDAGARQLRLFGRSNATDASATIVPGTTAAFALGEVMDVDPNTGIAWTFAGYNALKLGLEVTT